MVAIIIALVFLLLLLLLWGSSRQELRQKPVFRLSIYCSFFLFIDGAPENQSTVDIPVTEPEEFQLFQDPLRLDVKL